MNPRGVPMTQATKRLVREYETIYLLKAETPDDQVEEIKERLRGVVTRESGKVIRFTNQGKRKTAFPIGKNPKALYMHCLYVGSACRARSGSSRPGTRSSASPGS